MALQQRWEIALYFTLSRWYEYQKEAQLLHIQSIDNIADQQRLHGLWILVFWSCPMSGCPALYCHFKMYYNSSTIRNRNKFLWASNLTTVQYIFNKQIILAPDPRNNFVATPAPQHHCLTDLSGELPVGLAGEDDGLCAPGGDASAGVRPSLEQLAGHPAQQ